MTTMLPNLLPAAERELVHSSDVPSAVGVRPFGLTFATVVPDDELTSLDGLRYDPVLQLNVATDGTPVTAVEQVIRMGTSVDTRHDSQWFVDKD